ncbi:Phosphoglycerol transferase and related proteins, alkaline phosphatase superfamily [hydrothermal vent metagenome]|uniref:Phosphoglycerol transferase and related proteins, alkaline phosphatase superfamily n=1 Tax=hydrothermal vent metagenome TaxID=652676 RepID=A0A1W1CQP7_9ZZZZ
MFKNWLKVFSLLLITNITTKLLSTFAIFYYGVINISFSKTLTALVFGLKFDFIVSAIFAFILFLFFLFKSANLNKNLLIISIVLIWLSQTGGLIYFLESGRHISYEINDISIELTSLIQQALNTYPWLITISIIFLVLLLKILKIKPFMVTTSKIIISTISVIFITVLIIRGNIVNLPLSPLSVYALSNSSQSTVATNVTYNMLYGILGREKHFVKKININHNTQDISHLYLTNKQNKNKNFKNVFIFFLESWASVRMNKNTTPNYFNLANQGITPKTTIAGGLRTTEGLFSTLCSWQNPLGGSVAQNRLQNNDLNCLPEILKKHNYQTVFYQGSHKDTSGVGFFAQKLGFQTSLGKKQLKTSMYEHNSWGMHDFDIYNNILENIKTIKKPFLIGVNTNTTHDTSVPKGWNKFKDKRLNALYFSDAALGDFMDKFKKQYPKIFNNTLFVILADHTAGVRKQDITKFKIPLTIIANDIKAKKLNRITSQRDVAPTVLDYLGIKTPQYYLGKSLLSNNPPFFADYYNEGKLTWIEKDKTIKINLLNNSQQCFEKNKSVECDNKFITIRNNALSFTKYSQDNLFNNTIIKTSAKN